MKISGPVRVPPITPEKALKISMTVKDKLSVDALTHD